MKGYKIATGTVTHAIRARDLLRKNGFSAKIERIDNVEERIGCGYTVVIEKDLSKAKEILQNGGVKILKVIENNH